MRRFLSSLYETSPKEILLKIRGANPQPSFRSPATAHDDVLRELQERFRRYQSNGLQGIDRQDFARLVQSKEGQVDAQSEGYSDEELERQRDLSVKFHWGHDHDFGDFQMRGRMGDRHLRLMADFATLFPVSIADFDGKNVLDVGCWTGGTSLMLASLGANVVALEEVRKYADTARLLADSFGLSERVTIEPLSVYQCNEQRFFDRFDAVYFPGVIYHLSDPLLSLRILWNSLKIGGTILIESAGINRAEPLCRFEGSLVYTKGGTRERLNRGGWNWFLPSPSALYRMMREAGFEDNETVFHRGRVYGFGRKTKAVGICKAGLSVPDIR